MSSDSAKLDLILQRLAAIEAQLASGAGGGSTGAPESGEGDIPASIVGFDKYTAEYLDPFCVVCDKLGGDAKEAGDIIKGAWAEMRSFLLMAAKCKEPSQAELPALLAGVSGKVKAASALVKRNEWEKHTKTCSEGIGCLNW